VTVSSIPNTEQLSCAKRQLSAHEHAAIILVFSIHSNCQKVFRCHSDRRLFLAAELPAKYSLWNAAIPT